MIIQSASELVMNVVSLKSMPAKPRCSPPRTSNAWAIIVQALKQNPLFHQILEQNIEINQWVEVIVALASKLIDAGHLEDGDLLSESYPLTFKTTSCQTPSRKDLFIRHNYRENLL